MKNKSAQKILEKIPKNIHEGRLQKPEGDPEGGTPWPGASTARLGGGRATCLPGPGGPPLRLPFGIYLALVTETLEEDSAMQNSPLFRRRRDSCPGTLPEGGLISGGPSITMIASGMLRE